MVLLISYVKHFIGIQKAQVWILTRFYFVVPIIQIWIQFCIMQQYGHHKNVTTNFFEYMIALVGVGWIVVFRPAYKRAGQLMRVIVIPLQSNVCRCVWYVAKSEKAIEPTNPQTVCCCGPSWSFFCCSRLLHGGNVQIVLSQECSLLHAVSYQTHLGGVAAGEVFLVHIHTVHSSCQWNLI